MRKGNCLIRASGPSWVLHGVDPHTDNSSSADDIQAPKQQPLGRISVKLPNDEWLCRKMDKLNVTGFSRCLSKVQSSMQVQLRKIQSEQSKGKSSEKTSSATDELQYLMNFNSRITQCMVLDHASFV